MYPSSILQSYNLTHAHINPTDYPNPCRFESVARQSIPLLSPARKKLFRPSLTKLGYRNNPPGVADTITTRGEYDEGSPHIGGISMSFGLYFFGGIYLFSVG